MEHPPRARRTDTAARVIAAAPQAVYRAFVDPQALMAWLPPHGMRGRLEAFDPREGGAFRMVLVYQEPDAVGRGKTRDDQDEVRGRFLELAPGERIVQSIEFTSDDPAFAGTMTMAWTLRPVPGGTEVTITASDVPPGIRPEDHQAGFRSTLENLAAHLEARAT